MPYRKASDAAESVQCGDMHELLKLIGHEICCDVLKRLAFGPCCVSNLAKLAGNLEISDISSHLGDLFEAGLVLFDKEGKWSIYRLAPYIGVIIEPPLIVLTIPMA